jgi:hypothetical protein
MEVENRSRNGKMEKLKGVLVGMLAIVGLCSIAVWIVLGSDNYSSVDKINYALLSVFIGLSTGHYIGKSLIEESEIKQYVFTGATLTVSTVFCIYILVGSSLKMIGVLSLCGILICFLLSLILGHDIGFIQEEENLEDLIQSVASQVSPAIITLITAVKVSKPLASPGLVNGLEILALIIIGILVVRTALVYEDEIRDITSELKRVLGLENQSEKED